MMEGGDAIADQDYIDAAIAGLEPKQAWKVLNVIGSGRLEGLEPKPGER